MASTGLALDAQLSVAAQVTQARSAFSEKQKVSRTMTGWKPLKVVMTTSLPRERQVPGGRYLHKNMAPERARQQHVVPMEKVEVIASLDDWAVLNLLPMLKPVSKSWQPQDFLPDASSESFFEDVRELRRRARELPDDYLVCLVGDMITEEALPTYQTMINTFEGVRDQTGSSPTPWGVWIRAWTAEENRHGDLLNRYLYLSGRVDMKMVETTTQYLIGSGMQRGEHQLATICGIIASDEKRHEIAYSRIVAKLFDLDPNGAMLSFQEMMKKKITMPAHLMYDGENERLFDDYASVAQRCGVYTALDYASIMKHLITLWDIEHLTGLSSEAQEAQDFICKLPTRVHRLAERSQSRAKGEVPRRKSFSWIHNRGVDLL